MLLKRLPLPAHLQPLVPLLAPAFAGFGAAGVDDALAAFGVGVLQLAGPPRVGKTLLALHAALRVLLADAEATAHWLDTEGAFNASRAAAVLAAYGVEGEEAGAVLDRLTVSRVFTPDALFDVLGGIDARAKVLVLDNAGALFRDGLMGSSAEGHATMVSAMETLASLTHTRGLLTLVLNATASASPTNPASVFTATTLKPALGASFPFTCDVELLLQDSARVFGLADEGERERAGKAGLRIVVEVVKSRVSTSGVWAVVDTDGTALFDVVPPPRDDETTAARSAGYITGRPAIGPLAATLAGGSNKPNQRAILRAHQVGLEADAAAARGRGTANAGPR
ncbi:DNA repair protein rhp51 [Vanrija pseudolonga]|uniref:DNA repair protein rhp51 n=1 Tax=Vanrija pseudolonga TaxID=143232 RepID=A0AAF0YFL4_9TREE|nr:DNA repair protein rhp51 [Vanrija pseudolonga]